MNELERGSKRRNPTWATSGGVPGIDRTIANTVLDLLEKNLMGTNDDDVKLETMNILQAFGG